MFTFTIEGLEPLIEAFGQAQVELPGQFQRAMVASVVDIKQTAQDLVPVRTSQLRTSITEIVHDNPLMGTVSVGQPYGKFVEFGTAPHVIVPRNAKALAFTVGGKLVFAKKVNHPGTKGKPFMQPAFEQNRQNVLDYFQRAVDSVLNQLSS
jgi:HK97 gp10 family phage protein